MSHFFRWLPVVSLLALCLCSGAFAAEQPVPDDASGELTPPPVTVETTEGEKDITVNVTVVNEPPPVVESEEAPASVPDALDPVSVEFPEEVSGSDCGVVVRDLAPVSEDSRSPLLDSVSALLGEYRPRTVTVSTYLNDGSIVQSEEPVPGLAGLDWEWLAGAALFSLALYCIFRMIGGFLKWTQ